MTTLVGSPNSHGSGDVRNRCHPSSTTVFVSASGFPLQRVGWKPLVERPLGTGTSPLGGIIGTISKVHSSSHGGSPPVRVVCNRHETVSGRMIAHAPACRFLGPGHGTAFVRTIPSCAGRHDRTVTVRPLRGRSPPLRSSCPVSSCGSTGFRMIPAAAGVVQSADRCIQMAGTSPLVWDERCRWS